MEKKNHKNLSPLPLLPLILPYFILRNARAAASGTLLHEKHEKWNRTRKWNIRVVKTGGGRRLKVFTERSTRCVTRRRRYRIDSPFFSTFQPKSAVSRYRSFRAVYIRSMHAVATRAKASVELFHPAPFSLISPRRNVFFFSHFFCATHARKIASAHYDLSRSVYPSPHHGVARLTFALIRRSDRRFSVTRRST